MSPAELLERAADHGVTVAVDGDALRLRAPAPPPEELVEDLRQHKPELLAYLRRERALPTDPAGACAWCGGPLGGRRRLCWSCTNPDVELREQEPSQSLSRVARSPRPTTPERRGCPGCGGGLQPDGDVLCGCCRWTAEHLAPRRVQ